MRSLMVSTLVAATLALSGCASTSQVGQSEKLALYRSHAGEPVPSFRLFGSLTSWTALGENALAVWTRPNEAWLLELSAPCRDLDFATAIGLTDSAGRVAARFDRVIPQQAGGGSTMQLPCIIQTIRPLDTSAIRAGERELREGAAAGKAQPSGT